MSAFTNQCLATSTSTPICASPPNESLVSSLAFCGSPSAPLFSSELVKIVQFTPAPMYGLNQ